MNKTDIMDQDLEVPPEWEAINVERLRGTIMVIGGPDTGKTTFSIYLQNRLRSLSMPTACLDGDPGQARLGPPTTISLSLPSGSPITRNVFIGSPSPSGHMLPLLVGAARLVREACEAGARALVYDTTGLIDPNSGGLHLKLAKINLLQPSLLVAFQQDNELAPLLRPLRNSKRLPVIDFRPSDAVKARSREERRTYRAARFARYFHGAPSAWVNWSDIGVFPCPRFSLHRLVALEDRDGFILGLGIVMAAGKKEKSVLLMTPVSFPAELSSLTLGDLAVDPVTFSDRPEPLR